ncbi:695_t:CDS:2, partial [Ambispora leptoticha]
FSTKDSKVIEHAELPPVTDEVSVTLRLNILNNSSNWACIFNKGGALEVRTPALILTANNSAPHVRFSMTGKGNAGIDSVGNGLSLNKWYHLACTLSEPKKRLDFYIDGKWTGFQSVQQVQTQRIIFNNGPLYIGKDRNDNGFTGLISNFRYYNWHLSAKEVKEEYLALISNS